MSSAQNSARALRAVPKSDFLTASRVTSVISLVCTALFGFAAFSEPRNASYTQLPLCFEQGANSSDRQYFARGLGYEFQVNRAGARVSLGAPGSSNKPTTGRENIEFVFVSADPDARAFGESEMPGKINYLVGEPSQWRSGVPAFRKVHLRQLYPGVDAVFYGNQRQLEYDLLLNPGADPSRIKLMISGGDGLALNKNGDLLIASNGRTVIQHKPMAYQVRDGQKREVAAEYILAGRNVTFKVGEFDPALPLVIDPVLSYSSYLGGPGDDAARAITADGAGNIYIAGDTLSGQIATPNALQTLYSAGYLGGGGDAFVAKFDPTGANLLYLTYLGGSGNEYATALATDTDGNLYVTGVTDSTNFPMAGLSLSTKIGGKGEFYFGMHPLDAFISKLSPDGSQLLYSTYFGAEGDDFAFGLALDPDRNIYVCGTTESRKFPVLNAFQAEPQGKKGQRDAFVSKITADGSALVFSTYLGGTNMDYAQSLAVDAAGRVHVTGYTLSTNFPVTANAFQQQGSDLYSQAFVSILESDGASIVSSTLIGSAGETRALRIALDAEGNNYIAGSQVGSGFPVIPGGINPGGVYVSSDAGGTWTFSSQGMLNNQVHGLIVDPLNSALVLASTSRGMYRSVDSGASWHLVLDTQNAYPGMVIDPSSTIYAAGIDVIRSTDGGLTWEQVNPGFKNEPFNKLLLDPASTSTMYAATEGTVRKSTDGGFSWQALNHGLPKGSVPDVAISASVPGSLYAIAGKRIYHTGDAGQNWATLNTWPTNETPRAIVVNPATPSLVYVGTYSGKIFASSLESTNWVELGELPKAAVIYNLTLDPASPQTIVAGTSLGVFKSTDGATTWVQLGIGMPEIPVLALVLDPHNSARVYAGTFGQPQSGGSDAFVVKLTPSLDAIVYSVLLGGAGNDQAQDLKLDALGNAYITGFSASTDFPIVDPVGALGGRNSGNADAFVAAVNAAGNGLLFSTFVGGRGDDFGTGLVLTPNGIFVTGETLSREFPTVSPQQASLAGGAEAFLLRLNVVSAANVNVTFQTEPPGLSLLIDNATNVTPVTFSWPYGSYHSIAAPGVNVDTGVRYGWTQWSDGGAFSRVIQATNDLSLTASFRLQYYLSVTPTNTAISDTNLQWEVAMSGALHPYSGWYDAGTNVTLFAVPPFGNDFNGWLGSGPGAYSGSENPVEITLGGPVTEVAVFSGPLTNLLRVVVNGTGTVSPNNNGHALKLGKSYTVTAKPGHGYVFSNWTGGVVSYNPKLTFFMEPGLVLEANFVPTPFIPLQGSFGGLFYDPYLVEPQSAGYCSLKITDQGKFSGSVLLAGKKTSFSGQLLADGSATFVVLRNTASSLNMHLQLDMTTGAVVTGRIASGNWSADLTANRVVYSNANPAPQAGKKYTVVFPGAADSPGQPAGDSYGTVSVDKAGNVTFSGTMADGTKVSQKTFLSAQGEWPLYGSLYSGTGLLLGPLTLASTDATDISGIYYWHKQGLPVDKMYPGGFHIQGEVVASEYSQSAPPLNLPAGGVVVLDYGGLPAAMQLPFGPLSGNAVKGGPPEQLRLSFSSGNGLFSGSVKDPEVSKSITFGGAVLQKQNRGAGAFVRNKQGGRVRISEAP